MVQVIVLNLVVIVVAAASRGSIDSLFITS